MLTVYTLARGWTTGRSGLVGFGGVSGSATGTAATFFTVGVTGFGGFTGLGLMRFNWAWVAGKGLMRLMPGTAFLSANQSPSRITNHSRNVFIPMQLSSLTVN